MFGTESLSRSSPASAEMSTIGRFTIALVGMMRSMRVVGPRRGTEDGSMPRHVGGAVADVLEALLPTRVGESIA